MCLPLHPRASFAPIDQLRAAGLNYVSINVGMDMNPVSQILPVIAGYRATIAAHPEKYTLVSSVADIAPARLAGQIAIGFDLEGAMPLLDQPDMVALYASLGVRQIHFAYNRNNSVADGCHDAERGLTPLGRRMVHAVNDAGLLMDCSHTGRRCSLEIMQASAKPVIFSHANPLALVEHGRNISDEQIRADEALTLARTAAAEADATAHDARETAREWRDNDAVVSVHEFAPVTASRVRLTLWPDLNGWTDLPSVKAIEVFKR